jgi:hypothetical protein
MALLFGMYDDDPVGWRLGGGDGGDVDVDVDVVWAWKGPIKDKIEIFVGML